MTEAGADAAAPALVSPAQQTPAAAPPAGMSRSLAVELIMSRIDHYPDTAARLGAAGHRV